MWLPQWLNQISGTRDFGQLVKCRSFSGTVGCAPSNATTWWAHLLVMQDLLDKKACDKPQPTSVSKGTRHLVWAHISKFQIDLTLCHGTQNDDVTLAIYRQTHSNLRLISLSTFIRTKNCCPPLVHPAFCFNITLIYVELPFRQDSISCRG